MEILRFEESPRKSGLRITKSRGLVAVLGVFAFAALGTTLAGSISLNSGSSIEFGQAVLGTTACDGDGITIAPTSKFVNATGGTGSFTLGSIALTGISANCAGKQFTIKAFDNVAGSDALNLVSVSGTTPYYEASFTAASTTLPSAGTTAVWGGSSNARTATIGFTGPTVLSTSVEKITVETADK